MLEQKERKREEVILLRASSNRSSDLEQTYSKAALNLLEKFFPDAVCPDSFVNSCKDIPLVQFEKLSGDSILQYSIRFLCHLRPGMSRFFYDMTSRWLIPNKKTSIIAFFVVDFQFQDRDEVYTIGEIILCLEDLEDEWTLLQNMKALQKEIALGARSSYLANRILEIKGLSSNEKVAYIHERIAHIVRKIPSLFDYDIFPKMQHFLIIASDEFKIAHEWRHMSRIIYIFYLFQKNIGCALEKFPYQRHFMFKFVPLKLRHPLGIRKALSIFIGLNFLKEHEVFDKRHMVKAIMKTMPELSILDDSFLINKQGKCVCLYIEVEKPHGENFSLEEIKNLSVKFPNQVEDCIEYLLRPVFMPRNEEEVMRNLVLLSQQLKYVKDVPHIMISFDEHTDKDLFFTIVMARVLIPTSHSLQSLLKKNPSKQVIFTVERVKRVGKIRKKYFKEVSVIQARVVSNLFLRENSSFDLYAARQRIVEILGEVIGEIRDFNGGMLAKQHETLTHLQGIFSKDIAKNKFLLENFFHAIFPAEQRSILSVELLESWFILFKTALESVDRQEPRAIKISKKEQQYHLLTIIKFCDISLKQLIVDKIDSLDIPSSDLAILHIQVYETSYLGYSYFYKRSAEKKAFLQGLEQISI